MKKLLFIAFLLPLFSSAQTLTIKLATQKTIYIEPQIINPGRTIATDSIVVEEFCDDGYSVKATVLYVGVTPVTREDFIVWEGAEYIKNKNYTKTQLKARIKTLLSQ